MDATPLVAAALAAGPPTALDLPDWLLLAERFQTLIAAIIALSGGWFVLRAARHNRQTIQDQIDAADGRERQRIAADRERDDRLLKKEIQAVAASLASEIDGLVTAIEMRLVMVENILSHWSDNPMKQPGDADVVAVQSYSRLPSVIVYPAVAGRLGLVGEEVAPVVVRFYAYYGDTQLGLERVDAETLVATVDLLRDMYRKAASYGQHARKALQTHLELSPGSEM